MKIYLRWTDGRSSLLAGFEKLEMFVEVLNKYFAKTCGGGKNSNTFYNFAGRKMVIS